MAATANRRRRGPSPRAPFRTGVLAASLAVAFVAGPARAIDWDLTPSIGAAATLTDNASQRANNAEGSLIIGVTPGFSLVSKGSRRVQASLQYGLTDVVRFGGADDHDIFHNLNATGKAEVVEDFLFVDAYARISQELISLQGSSADATTNSRNRTNVGTYLFSPYIRQRFGTFAEAEVRTTASGAIFGNNSAADSEVLAFSAHLASGTRFNDLRWALDYSIREASNRNARDTTLERASLYLGYVLTPHFRVFGTVGRDSNDYLSSTSTSGSSYSVGFGWAPSRRTNLEAAIGERYFGRTYSLAASHRTRQTQWQIRYAEDVSDITQQLLTATSAVYYDCGTSIQKAGPDGQPPSAGCTSRPITAGEIIATIMTRYPGTTAKTLQDLGLASLASVSGIYILKSLTAGVNWDVGRLGFGVSAQDTRRLYQVLGDAEDHIRGVAGSVTYRLAPQTTASAALALTRTTFDTALAGGISREEDVTSLSVGMTHRFSPRLTGGVSARHTQRDSSVANGSYDENAITATANMQF